MILWIHASTGKPESVTQLDGLACNVKWTCRFYTREALIGFQGLASGLAYIHSKGLVDLDLNSGNVLQRLDGSAWVKIDLGNAVEIQVAGRPNKIKRRK